MRRGRPPYPDLLTPREQQVLELLRQGLTNPQIADRLGISLYGARYHVSEILSKLGVSTREEAAAWQPEQEPAGSFRLPGLFVLPLHKLAGISGWKVAAGGAIAVAGVAFALLAIGVLTSADRDNGLGKLAYVVDGNIWVRDLPDGPPLQLTDSGSDLAPSWSASGEWLSFAREIPPGGPGETEVWVIRADGTGARKVGGGPMSWSPVDDTLAYWGDMEGMVVESADGLARRVLVPRPDDPYDPSPFGFYHWSPDGRWLSFQDQSGLLPGAGFTDPRYNITYRVPVAGGDPVPVYTRLAHIWDSKPEDEIVVDIREHGWSADGGTYLLSESVVSRAEHDAALEQYRQAGDGLHLLAVSPADGSVVETGVYTQAFELPSSPRGNQVLVSAGADLRDWKDRRIALVDPSTGASEYLTGPDVAAIDPAWSQDGEHIVYTAGPNAPGADWGAAEAIGAFSQRHIWLMDANGDNARQLTADPAYRDEQPHFTSGNDYVLFARIGLLEAADTISIWLLDLRDGTTELFVDNLFTSRERLRGRPYDVRTDSTPNWGQLFDYWHP